MLSSFSIHTISYKDMCMRMRARARPRESVLQSSCLSYYGEHDMMTIIPSPAS